MPLCLPSERFGHGSTSFIHQLEKSSACFCLALCEIKPDADWKLEEGTCHGYCAVHVLHVMKLGGNIHSVTDNSGQFPNNKTTEFRETQWERKKKQKTFHLFSYLHSSSSLLPRLAYFFVMLLLVERSRLIFFPAQHISRQKDRKRSRIQIKVQKTSLDKMDAHTWVALHRSAPPLCAPSQT